MSEGVQNIIPEEEANVQNGEHPLLNSLIMENVFSFMESTVSVKDLKNFRLVCQVWSESSLKVWRKVAPLRLGPPERSIKTRSQGLEAPPPDNYLPVNNFLEMMTNSSRDPHQLQQKPFSNLVLFGIHFNRLVPICLKSTSRVGETNFWSYLKNGRNAVKFLGFHGCYFTEKVFLETCLNNLEVVEKLKFANIQRGYPDPGLNMADVTRLSKPLSTEVFPLKELEISGNAPPDICLFMMVCFNLEKLAFRGNYPPRDYTLKDFIHIRQVRNRSYEMKKLDALESRFFESSHDVSRLVHHANQDRIRCPLELLTLTLETYDPSSEDDFEIANSTDLREIFQPLVELSESTLKILKVFRAPIHNVIPNNEPLFPRNMSVLEELHLYGNLVAGFSFLEQTPNLKVLRIDTRCSFLGNHMKRLYFADRSPAKVTWFRNRYHPHQEDLLNGTGPEIRVRLHLEHMMDLHLECNMTPDTIRFLGRWMPNLKVFKAIMMDDVWKAVCQWMPDLEEVGILRGSQVGEEALTGLNSFDEGATREPLSIVRLSNLRRFVYMAFCGQSTTGDLSVRRGLLEMPKLGVVNVCVSKQLSLEAEAALKKGILNVTIVRNTDDECRGGWDCCADSNFLREFNN